VACGNGHEERNALTCMRQAPAHITGPRTKDPHSSPATPSIGSVGEAMCRIPPWPSGIVSTRLALADAPCLTRGIGVVALPGLGHGVAPGECAAEDAA